LYTVNYTIIHKLIKARHGKATVVERPVDLPITDPVKKLVLDVHNLYSSRVSKGYGRFDPDEINYPVASILRKLFQDKTLDFSEASKVLVKNLATRADSVPLATGGYVLMASLSNASGINWFIVAILNNTNGSAINDTTLEVIDSVHVDLENLRVAGRVNISEWLGGDPKIRYIGFLKQRDEVADYFKLFLGCNEFVSDTEETKKLVAALKKFSKQEGLDAEKEENFLQTAFNFCNEHKVQEKPLSLEALSNAVWPNDPEKLQVLFIEDDLQIHDGFVPDGRSIKSLVKIKSKTAYWSINLDRHAFSTGYAHYNQQKGELILRNLPAELRSELDREIKDGS
jgi:nucleoid-associated protein